MPDAPSREFASLLLQVARCPTGTATLREAHLDCAATTLRMHPFVVDAARDFLNATDGWVEFEERIAAGSFAGPEVAQVDLDGLLEGASTEAEALIERTESKQGSSECLCEGDGPEIAKTHGVHPYVVFRARGILERKAICTKKK